MNHLRLPFSFIYMNIAVLFFRSYSHFVILCILPSNLHIVDHPTQQVRRLSRVPSEPPHQLHGADEWGAATSSDVHLTGIACLTLWRMMRDELKLCSYTLEAVAAHVLHKRVPHVSARTYSSSRLCALNFQNFRVCNGEFISFFFFVLIYVVLRFLCLCACVLLGPCACARWVVRVEHSRSLPSSAPRVRSLRCRACHS